MVGTCVDLSKYLLSIPKRQLIIRRSISPDPAGVRYHTVEESIAPPGISNKHQVNRRILSWIQELEAFGMLQLRTKSFFVPLFARLL